MNLLNLSEQPTGQISTIETDKSDSNLMTLVSWLFLIGSLIFQMDAIVELTEGMSLHVAFHLSASLLFTIGSVLFVLQDAQQK